MRHYGAVIEPSMEQLALEEMRRNRRYRWYGQVTRGKLRRIMARSWLMILSSKLEGGANVLAEAIVADLPVLSSKIPGSVGMLGEDYNGYFPVGKTKQLQALLQRCERDPEFYGQLQMKCAARAELFAPKGELQAWKSLLADCR